MGCWVEVLLFTTLISLLLQDFKLVAASVDEGEQLQVIKQGILDARSLQNWKIGTNPCETNWYRVTCNGDSVTELDLSNLLLRGSLSAESFAKLPGLTKLLFANNSFTGSLPETLFNLSNLTHLDISYNIFSGTISGFERLTKLQVLSLTGNPFQTDIGIDFQPLNELRYVLLSDCGFQNSFPLSLLLLPNLYALDLENNFFTGDLPDTIWRISSLAILGLANSGLDIVLSTDDLLYLRQFRYLSLPEAVAKKLPNALRKALPSLRNTLCIYVEWIKCTIPPSTPSLKKPQVVPDSVRKKNRTRAIIGGVLGGSAFLLIGSFAGVYFVLKYRSRRSSVTDFATKAGLELDTITFSQSFVVAHAFMYAELQQATDNFNLCNLVGEGSFGQVFRGVLTNGKVVAIKKMDVFPSKYTEAEIEFRIEVDLLSRLNHPNLVRLFGYCADGKHRLIVYEFLSNGSLESYFEGRSQYRSGFRLDFRRRLLIALGSAKGLAFLHGGGEDGNPIIHRDFKASNVLLDEFFSPKISDFGFAKLLHRSKSHCSTRVIGTFGYFDPHYTTTGRLTVKTDVYSFGVVLLQLLTGKSAVVSMGEDDIPQNIVSWSQNCLNDKKKLKRILDKDLGFAYPAKCAHRLALLASCCLRENADGRPSMLQCVKVIEEILVDCVMHLENINK